MAGFDNRYGTEYGGLAAQMTGVEQGRQGAQSRRMALGIDRRKFERQMEMVDAEAAAAAARAKSGSVGDQISLARMMADQSQHQDKMALDEKKFGLDAYKTQFQTDKMSAETALLRQEFAGVEQVAATMNNPTLAGLARAGQLGKAENVQRALLTQGIMEGRFTPEDVIAFNAGWGDFIGVNEGASLMDRELVAQRNLENNMIRDAAKPRGGKGGGSVGNPEKGMKEFQSVLGMMSGVDPKEASYTAILGRPNDKYTALLAEFNKLDTVGKANLMDATSMAETLDQKIAVVTEGLGLDKKQFRSEQAPVANWFSDFVGPAEALVAREEPDQADLIAFTEAHEGKDPYKVEADILSGKDKGFNVLAEEYPAWAEAYKEEIKAKIIREQGEIKRQMDREAADAAAAQRAAAPPSAKTQEFNRGMMNLSGGMYFGG